MANVLNLTGSTPNTGPSAGGTVVTIAGTHFMPGTTVTFGGIPATNVIVVNNTTIKAVTPPYLSGFLTVNIVVNNGISHAVLPAAFTYKLGNLATDSISPDRLPTEMGDTSFLVDENWAMTRAQREIVQEAERQFGKVNAKNHEDPNQHNTPSDELIEIPQHPYLQSQAFDGEPDQTPAPPLNDEARTEYDNELRLQNQLKNEKNLQNKLDTAPKPGLF